MFQAFLAGGVRRITQPDRWNPVDFASCSASEGFRRMQGSFDPPGFPFAAAGRSEFQKGEFRFPIDRYYVEHEIVAGGTIFLGFATPSDNLGFYPGYHTKSYSYRSNGQKFNNGSGASFGDSYTTGDRIGIAIDQINGNIWFSKNGVWQASGNPAAGTNPAFTMADIATTAYRLAFGFIDNGSTIRTNFGNAAFTHAPPSGFVAGWGK